MSFTVRCSTCKAPMDEHIVVRVRNPNGVLIQKTTCPRDHKLAWLKKWRWKFKSEADALRAYRRVTFRATKVGRPGPRRPGSELPKSKNPNICDYCGRHRADHEGKALYCPTSRNDGYANEDKDTFAKRGSMQRYSVRTQGGKLVGHVKARNLVAAVQRAKKTYGIRNAYSVKMAEHGEKAKGRHAPWHAKTRRKKMDACGYCGRRMLGGATDKKYKLLCAKCKKRVDDARRRAQTGKFSDRDPTMQFYVTIKYLDKRKGTIHHIIKVIIANDANEAKRIARRELAKHQICITVSATRMAKKTGKEVRSRSPFAEAYAYTRRKRRPRGPYKKKDKPSRDFSHEQPAHSPSQVIRAYKSVEIMLKLAKTAVREHNKPLALRILNGAERVMLNNFEDAAHAVHCGNCIPNAAKARELHQLMKRCYKMFDDVAAMIENLRTKKPRRARRK